MNQASESGHLGPMRSAGESSPDKTSTTSSTATPLATATSTRQASPQHTLTAQSTAGTVRRRKKQPRNNPQDSDSDSDMETDPEAGDCNSLTLEETDSRRSLDMEGTVEGREDPAESSGRRLSFTAVNETPGNGARLAMIEVKETTALKDDEQSSDDDGKASLGGHESDLDFAHLKQQADEFAHKIVQKVKDVTWNVTHHNYLPDWLRDNDFLHNHHRPQLDSFKECIGSIFRIHTETGNIWTHLLGCIAFIVIAIIFVVRSTYAEEEWQEIFAYMMFFLGAILCLGFSCLFHTMCCHSHKFSKIFSKLDYSGITFLIVGSFVPWLYFGFYCENIIRYVYLALIISLGAVCLFVALNDAFGLPKYRPLRAGLYVALGLSGVIPAIHYVSIHSFFTAIHGGGLGWMFLMACLYIFGAALYAIRIPERWFPGKCDIWFQSHQIFHLLVLAAAFVHYHGINTMAAYRDRIGECDAPGVTDLPPTTIVN